MGIDLYRRQLEQRRELRGVQLQREQHCCEQQQQHRLPPCKYKHGQKFLSYIDRFQSLLFGIYVHPREGKYKQVSAVSKRGTA